MFLQEGKVWKTNMTSIYVLILSAINKKNFQVFQTRLEFLHSTFFSCLFVQH